MGEEARALRPFLGHSVNSRRIGGRGRTGQQRTKAREEQHEGHVDLQGLCVLKWLTQASHAVFSPSGSGFLGVVLIQARALKE